VRLLIVGGGSIGERHARCFREARRSLRIEICEPRAARRREIARQRHVSAVHADLAGLDLSAFDAAVVAAPAHLHVRIAGRLVAAGCHVLIEKPLCVSERGVRGLISRARRERRTVGVGYTYRSYPALLKMAREIRAGRIGRPLAARATMAYNYPLFRPDYSRNYFAKAETGGGAVMDVASHALAFLSWVLGPVAEVSCAAERMRLARVRVEDTAALLLRFRSGALAEVWASAWQPRRRTEIEVMGPKGQLRYRTLFGKRRCLLDFNPGDARPRKRGHYYDSGRPWRPLDDRRFDADEPFVRQARNFLAAIAGREPVRTDLEEALHVNRVCRAALRSSRSGRAVRVGERR
jgi:predicted dehydrogenase